MHPATVSEAELDEACLRMLPHAQRFVAAVRSRDPAHIRAAFAAIQTADVPDGLTQSTVLAYVLADEVISAQAAADSQAAGAAMRAERERCMRLAVNVARGTGTAVIDRAKRLPQKIARGDAA